MSLTLSVVLPHYNHGRYVAGCLEALLSQSRPPDELFLVDDGSTDGSLSIIESIAAFSPRMWIIRHEKNQGCARSLADGLARCNGDYVFMPAADDLVFPGFFEKSMAILAQYPNAGLCSTLVRIIGEDGRDLGSYLTPVVRRCPSYLSSAEFIDEYQKHGSWVTSTSAIFRRSAVLEAGGCPADLGPTVDGYLINALGTRYGSCFIPEELVAWRPSKTSMSFTFASTADRAVRLIETQDSWLASYGVPSEHRLRLRRSGFQELLNHLTFRRPFPLEEARSVADKIPEGGIALSFYRAALALGAGLGVTKLYVFWLLPFRVQARSILKKLKRFVGHNS